jgi:hypothetical protein
LISLSVRRWSLELNELWKRGRGTVERLVNDHDKAERMNNTW